MGGESGVFVEPEDVHGERKGRRTESLSLEPGVVRLRKFEGLSLEPGVVPFRAVRRVIARRRCPGSRQ
ncbi:hypothetical protein D8S78_15025 [Natrialba swarupiae]|nr:hypothetical protein [Natrialba swarupiae]